MNPSPPPAAGSRSEATPILDRVTPLPPLQTAPAERTLAWMLAAAGVTAAILLGAFGHARAIRGWVLAHVALWFPGPWTVTRAVGVIASVIVVSFTVVAIHEIGHVLAGLAAGFRFHGLRVSLLQVKSPFRIARHRGPGTWAGGGVDMSPAASGGHRRLRGAVYVLGGPVANFLAAAAVLSVPRSGFTAFLCDVFALVSIGGGLADLVPYRSSAGDSDGRRLWTLLADRRRGERFLALLELNAEMQRGVLPESLPAAAIAAAVAYCDNSVDTVGAHAIATSVAFHQHRDDDAARHLETCLQYSRYTSSQLRVALMGDAAHFLARRRGRPDLAEQWLADMPATTQPPWLRTRAEAAILGARGDVAGALGKLAAVEMAVAAIPEHGRRAILTAVLQRWRLELAA